MLAEGRELGGDGKFPVSGVWAIYRSLEGCRSIVIMDKATGDKGVDGTLSWQ
jgi:hypothetical protein